MSATAWVLVGALAGVALLQVYRILPASIRGPLLGDAFTYLRTAREMRRQRSAVSRALLLSHRRARAPAVATAADGAADAGGESALCGGAEPRRGGGPADGRAGRGFVGHCSFSVSSPGGRLLAALLFLLTPLNAIMTASLTPRGLALLWLTAFVACLSAYVAGGRWLDPGSRREPWRSRCCRSAWSRRSWYW
jgi:hypothetical protein